MKVLLLSAYDAYSHRYWRKGLVKAFPDYEWTVLTLPARHFAWRVRGNALSWAIEQRELLEQDYDCVLATSMVDMTALRGLVPGLSNIPTLVYFHENQFAYPVSQHTRESAAPKILNLYTALCADRVIFNSDFNRQSFLQGARALLKRLPDHAPVSAVDDIATRTSVIPVPLADNCFQDHQQSSGALQIIWNHRWEYDKGPDLLLETVRSLMAKTDDFLLHVVGQQFRKQPDAFDQLKALSGRQLGAWGFIPEVSDYRSLLQQSDVVLSTAEHDFQGIAVLEAVAAGCVPLVPDKLAYPELFPKAYCYPTRNDCAQQADIIAGQLSAFVENKRRKNLPDSPSVRRLGWSAVRSAYQTLFEETAG